MGITVLISLYTTRVILNALGAADFGLFNVVGGAIAMLTFLNASMAAATQRFMSYAHGEGDPGKQKSIFNVSIVLHAGIAVAVVLLLEGAGLILFHGVFKIAPERVHAARMIYQFAAASTFFTILAVPYEAVITARENMLVFAILGVLEAILKLVVALYIVHWAGDKLTFYGFWMAAITILLLVLRALYCHARYTECALAPRRHFHGPLFREMTCFAGWSLLGSSSGMIANYGQGIVINTFWGTAVNAAQGISAQVSGQLGAFATTMQKALNPLITKSEGAGNRPQLVRSTMTGSKIGFALLMLFYVPVFLEMPFIFKLWLKEPPEYAVIFCRLLLIRNLVEQLYLTLWSAIAASGKIRSIQIVASVLNILPLFLSYLLFRVGLPPYVLYLAFMGYSIAMFWTALRFASRLCDIPYTGYITGVVLPCVASILLCIGIASAPTLLYPEGLRRLALCGAASLAAFFPVVWFFILNQSERAAMASFSGAIRGKMKTR